jgi:hypothetical protein
MRFILILLPPILSIRDEDRAVSSPPFSDRIIREFRYSLYKCKRVTVLGKIQSPSA